MLNESGSSKYQRGWSSEGLTGVKGHLHPCPQSSRGPGLPPLGILLRAALKRPAQRPAWPHASPTRQAGGPRLTFPNKINLAAASEHLQHMIFSRLTTWPACSWLLVADLNLELSVVWLLEKESAEGTRHRAVEGACVAEV